MIRLVRPKKGFTLVEIMIVVAIIGILAAMIIPNFMRARRESRKNTCIANLKQIDGAAQQYCLENRQPDSITVDPATDLAPYLKGTLKCPTVDQEYGSFVVSEGPKCPGYGVYDECTAHVLP